MVNVDNNAILPALGLIAATLADFSSFPFSPGFDIKSVASLAQSLPSHSWEFGTSAEALLELYNPELSVFGATPFPVPSLPQSSVRALNYAAGTVNFGTGYSALDKGNGAAGDPASLGVSAVMLGKTNSTFAKAAKETADGLLNDVPRYWNGAISHRANTPELWADFMYMVPPFLAYYAADAQNAELLQGAVKQCQLYRQILQPNITSAYKGVWMHIMGPESEDKGYWATGNAWAAAGMTRVLATVMKAPVVQDLTWRQQAIDNLTQYIKEIVDGAMNAPQDDGLLRNYLNDLTGDGHGFGEISGSSLLASAVYRMAVLQPQVFSSNYITWADAIRTTLGGNDASGKPYITSTGIATPAVNPLAWKDTKPFTKGSPEGQAMVVLMYAGWRDCVKAGVCASADGLAPVTPEADGSASVLNAVGSLAKRTHGGLRSHFARSH